MAEWVGLSFYLALGWFGAFTGFLLNLFNLLPVVPLDGGRAMAALAPWMWFVGFAGLVAAAFIFPNPIILLVILFGAVETLRRWQARKTPAAQEYYRVSPRARVIVAIVYIGLVILLAVAMHETHIARDFGDT